MTVSPCHNEYLLVTTSVSLSFLSHALKRQADYERAKRVEKSKNQITINYMNKALMTAADSTLGACSYESPKVVVTEIHSEGILCQSGSFEEWGEEDLW